MELMARVLILEPDEEIRELFAHMLTRLGHEPLTSAEEAGSCDAVLLEPAWEPGVALTWRLRHERRDLPVIAASVLSSPPGGASPLPVVRHLVKPFTLVQLADAVAEALFRRPQGQRGPATGGAGGSGALRF